MTPLTIFKKKTIINYTSFAFKSVGRLPKRLDYAHIYNGS